MALGALLKRVGLAAPSHSLTGLSDKAHGNRLRCETAAVGDELQPPLHAAPDHDRNAQELGQTGSLDSNKNRPPHAEDGVPLEDKVVRSRLLFFVSEPQKLASGAANSVESKTGSSACTSGESAGRPLRFLDRFHAAFRGRYLKGTKRTYT